ncbi:hypothetical protein BH09PAT1_BH09PAT1_2640 [soil metagenome]
MWPKRRVLKKDQKQLTKKRILLLSMMSGGAGLLFIVIGVVVLRHEPTFISPLPFLRSLGLANDQDGDKKTIETFLKQNTISYKNVTVSGKSTYIIITDGGGTAYLTNTKDISVQLSSLQRILSRLTMEGKKFSRLDLRYDKPVIVLQ